MFHRIDLNGHIDPLLWHSEQSHSLLTPHLCTSRSRKFRCWTGWLRSATCWSETLESPTHNNSSFWSVLCPLERLAFCRIGCLLSHLRKSSCSFTNSLAARRSQLALCPPEGTLSCKIPRLLSSLTQVARTSCRCGPWFHFVLIRSIPLDQL